MPYHFAVPDSKRVRVIVSTDAACEADDPFAIAHALLSPKLDVKAIIAEHFMAEGSMERSYDAACKLLSLMGSAVPVLHGQVWPKNGILSEGAQCIIDEARQDDPRKLFVLCMGAVTTLADALAAAPDIAENLTMVTIGGRGYGEDAVPLREFNWGNDPDAINYILKDTQVPVWQIPFSGYAYIRVSLAELQARLAPCGQVGQYLLRQMDEYNNGPYAGWTAGESWSLGDNPSVAVVLDDCAGLSRMDNAWRIDADTSYVQELPERKIRVFHHMDSRFVLGDLFAKLTLNFG